MRHFHTLIEWHGTEFALQSFKFRESTRFIFVDGSASLSPFVTKFRQLRLREWLRSKREAALRELAVSTEMGFSRSGINKLADAHCAQPERDRLIDLGVFKVNEFEAATAEVDLEKLVVLVRLRSQASPLPM